VIGLDPDIKRVANPSRNNHSFQPLGPPSRSAMTLHAGSGVRPECAKSGHTRTAWRTGQIGPLLPSKIGPANGMEARESGLRLKAWRRTRGGYSATAARLPLRLPLRPGDEARGRSRADHHLARPLPITLDELARAAEARRAVRVALLELELAGRVEYLADRIALCASANET
jgi:hypothetical protein